MAAEEAAAWARSSKTDRLPVRTFRFDQASGGTEVTAHGSSGVAFSLLSHVNGEAQLACLRLKPGGLLGRHPAAAPQLFVVVEGGGWVRTDDREASVGAGQAVLWEAGEEHESRAGADGMTAIVLEAGDLSGP